MCGRYNLRTNLAELGKVLDALPEDQYRSLLERYNIAPTTTVLAARLTDGQREIVPMKWGLTRMALELLQLLQAARLL